MIIELVQGVALLLALSWLLSINVRLWQGHSVFGQMAAGSAVGLIGVIGMLVPIEVSPGVIFDARSVLLSMTGLFGGALVGGVAALIAEGRRDRGATRFSGPPRLPRLPVQPTALRAGIRAVSDACPHPSH